MTMPYASRDVAATISESCDVSIMNLTPDKAAGNVLLLKFLVQRHEELIESDVLTQRSIARH